MTPPPDPHREFLWNFLGVCVVWLVGMIVGAAFSGLGASLFRSGTDAVVLAGVLPVGGFVGGLPALLVLAWVVRARHADPNRCRNCGYDLRESPQRCPECGALR